MDKYLIDQNTKSVYDVITFFLFLNYQKFSLFHENAVRDFIKTKYQTKQEDLDRNSPQYQNFLKSLYFLKLRDELRQTIVQLHSDILDEFKSSVEEKLIPENPPSQTNSNEPKYSEPTLNSSTCPEDRWELDQKNHQIDQEMARSELFCENIYFPTKYKISDIGQPIEVSKSQGLQMELDLITRKTTEADTDTVLIVPLHLIKHLKSNISKFFSWDNKWKFLGDSLNPTLRFRIATSYAVTCKKGINEKDDFLQRYKYYQDWCPDYIVMFDDDDTVINEIKVVRSDRELMPNFARKKVAIYSVNIPGSMEKSINDNLKHLNGSASEVFGKQREG